MPQRRLERRFVNATINPRVLEAVSTIAGERDGTGEFSRLRRIRACCGPWNLTGSSWLNGGPFSRNRHTFAGRWNWKQTGVMSIEDDWSPRTTEMHPCYGGPVRLSMV